MIDRKVILAKKLIAHCTGISEAVRILRVAFHMGKDPARDLAMRAFQYSDPK